MLEERPTKLIPLDQAIAELDSPEAVADRKKRVREWAKRLAGDERTQMIYTASREEISAATAPLNAADFRWGQGTEREKKEANVQASRNMDALVARQCEQHLRRTDEADLYRDPDRLEEQRIWNAYLHQVSAYAWRQGNKSERWVAQWRELIADRQATEEYGDPTAAIDARLLRHVGVPYPQLPQAAWDTADVLAAAERQAEYDRLTANTACTPVTDEAPKRRGRKWSSGPVGRTDPRRGISLLSERRSSVPLRPQPTTS